ncbi:cytochrome P450 [Actinomadura yumaensis]|uniref:cytochrome P450 n=1 Tax=Actinomadura yumaensis TaxID=111807 RepID=UPI0036196D74
MLLLTGSANRDPEVFADPDRFVLGRDTGASLAFGNGRHHCLGASLGRLEARVALSEIVAAVADFELDEDRAERVHSSNDRGFASLPTTVTPR